MLGGIDFENLANGLLILIVGLLTALGLVRKKPSAKSEEPMMLAGAIIDKQQAEDIIEALNRNTEQIKGLRTDLAKSVAAHSQSLEVAQRLRSDISEVGRDLRELTSEIIRYGRPR